MPQRPSQALLQRAFCELSVCVHVKLFYSDESCFRDMQLYNQLLFTMSLWAAAQMQSSKDANVTNVNAGMSVCHSRSCWRIPEVVYPLSISKSLWHALLCILHHKHDHRRTNVFVIMHNENMLINYSAST